MAKNSADGGKGIGRFAAFQLGETVVIETVGQCAEQNKTSKTIIPLSYKSFGKNINVSEIQITTQEEIRDGLFNTSYKVTISDFYDTSIGETSPRKKIVEKLFFDNYTEIMLVFSLFVKDSNFLFH